MPNQYKNNSLIVDYATESDEGYYMCQVSNGIGSELKKIIYVNVNGKAIMDFWEEGGGDKWSNNNYFNRTIKI